MKVYMMRHGDYDASLPEQPLSAAGHEAVRRSALFLKEQNLFGVQVWHSPKKRAVESAQIVCDVLDGCSLEELEFLKPDAVPQRILSALEGCEGDVILVSHLPLIPRVLAQIFPEQVFGPSDFPTAVVVVLECQDFQWRLVEIFR